MLFMNAQKNELEFVLLTGTTTSRSKESPLLLFQMLIKNENDKGFGDRLRLVQFTSTLMVNIGEDDQTEGGETRYRILQE